MRTYKEQIRSLQELLRTDGQPHPRVALGHADADTRLSGGLACGTLHEIYAGDAAAATGFTTALALRVGGTKQLLWIHQDFSALEHGELSATGFLDLGLDPSRVILMRAANASDALRAGADGLSCSALGAVVMEIPGNPKILDLTASRRLVLAAERKGVTAFLLRPEARAEASAAETRWIIRAAPSPANEDDDWGSPIFDAQLLRNRHGGTGHWIMEWSSDDGCFRQTNSGAVVPAPADRPLAAPLRLAG